jgi:hypothetical protein
VSGKALLLFRFFEYFFVILTNGPEQEIAVTMATRFTSHAVAVLEEYWV